MAIEAKKQQQRINEQIRVSPVRVIADDGAQLGIMTTDEAIKAARKVNLDLVEVAPNERPPVCRIMDFGKFKYQQKKRQHKGHAHQMKIKEIRVRPKTGEHDIEVKVNHAREFLAHKNKVIVTVVFRGRELAHIEEGRRVIDGVIPSSRTLPRSRRRRRTTAAAWSARWRRSRRFRAALMPGTPYPPRVRAMSSRFRVEEPGAPPTPRTPSGSTPFTGRTACSISDKSRATAGGDPSGTSPDS